MRKRALGLALAMIVGAVLVSVSGAATTKTQRVTRIDVSTRAAVIHYLRSIHVNPTGAVIQRGAQNYAGARCPGKGWTCASTRHTVVQIAGPGGQNRFVCRSSSCSVVQIGGATGAFYGRSMASTAGPKPPPPPGVASCIKTTGLTQSCSITQTNSGGNTAMVWEDAGKQTGLTQTASYGVSINQTAGPGSNLACVHQNVFIDGSTTNTSSKGATAMLEAHQSIAITQASAAGGNTLADATLTAGVAGCATVPVAGSCSTDLTVGCGLSQTQILTSIATSKGPIVQNENKNPLGPNLTLNIKQNCPAVDANNVCTGGSYAGQNSAIFTQTNKLSAIANSPAGATQWQSSADTGGILAAVHQYSTAGSTTLARQYEKQCEDAQPSGLNGCDEADQTDPLPSGYSLSQTQNGPVKKTPGDSSQTGNPANDHFTTVQGSQQDSDIASGQTNTVTGGFHTDGDGTVNQTTTVDGKTTTGTQAGTGDVSGSTNCTGTSCTSTTTPPAPIIDSGPTQPSTTSTDATFTFHDADTSATFLCQLDGGGYLPCTSPKTYNALDPGLHTFSVEAQQPSNGPVSDATSYPWTISSDNANVLIAGTGDPAEGGTDQPNNDLAAALSGAGYTVTELSALPSDLSSFGQVWWVDLNPPTTAEQNQLIAFEQSGRGVFLTGEWSDTTNNVGFGGLDAADQSMVNSMVTGGGITLGGEGCCAATSVAYTVNSGVVGNLATQPHTLASWTPTFPGLISGEAASSVFASDQPDQSTTEVAAAAWDRPSTVGVGRLVVFMDINWAVAQFRAANWSDVAENVAFFLSGLSSPPSQVVIQAPRMGFSLYGAPQMTPAPAAATSASGKTSSTK